MGKMGDATLVDVREDYIFYTYDVRGVGYTASQDVSALKHLIPDGPGLGGRCPWRCATTPAIPPTPSSCAEEWSGLRMLHPHT